MLRTVTTALILLATLSLARADDGAPTIVAGTPGEAIVRQAQMALDAGNPEQAIQLLEPRPTSGQGACVYGKASSLLADTSSHRARALLYLERCFTSTRDSDARSQLLALRQKLKQSPLAQVSLSIRPSDASATLSGPYSGDTLLAEDELWLPPGNYRLEVMAPGHQAGAYVVSVESSDRMLVPIVLPEDKIVGPTSVDLGEEPGTELGQVSTSADPRPKNFKTLLAKRYQGAPAPSPSAKAPAPPRNPMPWPAIVGGAAIASLGLGVGLQVSAHDTGALVSYGASAGLAGLAAYLLLRGESPPTEGTRIQVDEELISLSYRGQF